MLRTLFVKDFAIIDRAELSFGPGMTVLTGETGAGKSLLVDALMLLCGARGDAAVVRAGTERADLSAEFDVAPSDPAAAALAELELDSGSECRLRRVIRTDGTSRAFVNDRPVTLATLKALGELLIEIHGQHEHQALLSRARQLDLVDAFGGAGESVAEVAHLAHEWRMLEEQIVALRAQAGSGGEMIEILRFQLQELERIALAPDALQQLEDDHRRVANAGELIAGCDRAAELLDGDNEYALRRTLLRVDADMEKLAALDPGLVPVLESLHDATVQVDEAVSALDRHRAKYEIEPDRLDALDAQLRRLHDLARKHRVHVAELKSRETSMREEYEGLVGADERLAQLLARQAASRTAYDTAAARLSTLRQVAAKRLGRDISKLMGELGMVGGKFVVALETQRETAPSSSGRDTVEFLVSANPGQPERPLRKVASGGELSRIGLAIEVAALGKDEVATMVFDEVDAGVGGAVAEVVGRKLKEVGSARQVLCVTHLPQVAALADRHVAVRKTSDRKQTRTDITVLDADARLEEVARMLGGIEITPETRAHADDMLRRAGSL